MEVNFLQLHFNYISITFFPYFCNLENSKHKPKIAKTQLGQVKKRQKFRQEFGKCGKNKILLWYWRKLASNLNNSNLLPINLQLHLLWNCQLLYKNRTKQCFVLWFEREWAEAEKRKWRIFFLNAVYCERVRKSHLLLSFKESHVWLFFLWDN